MNKFTYRIRALSVGLLAAVILIGCGATTSSLQPDTTPRAMFQACGVDGGISCDSRPRSASHFLVKASDTPTEQGYCCKVCSVGKACGDSCISRDKVCHKPSGCACDR